MSAAKKMSQEELEKDTKAADKVRNAAGNACTSVIKFMEGLRFEIAGQEEGVSEELKREITIKDFLDNWDGFDPNDDYYTAEQKAKRQGLGWIIEHRTYETVKELEKEIFLGVSDLSPIGQRVKDYTDMRALAIANYDIERRNANIRDYLLSKGLLDDELIKMLSANIELAQEDACKSCKTIGARVAARMAQEE